MIAPPIARTLIAGALLLAAACQKETDGNSTTTESNTGSSTAAARGEVPKTNLLQALDGSADHKMLAKAVRSAGLTKTLSGAQPYTLFAPTEDAFGTLPAGAADGLLAPEGKGRLVALLTGHIVPGLVTAADLERAIERGKGKAQLATVGGSTLSFSRDGNAVVVTDSAGGVARIAGAETLASNGVVHSVDGVLGGK